MPQIIESSIRLTRTEEDICWHVIVSVVRELSRGYPIVRTNFYRHFFMIQKASGNWRFILNLKQLNEFIIASHFKTEDWKALIRLPGKLLNFSRSQGSLLITFMKIIRFLESETFLALSITDGDFDSRMVLSISIREDLLW